MTPTQQDIIRMAREAGIQGMCTDVICTWSELTKFAQLVSEAKQKECANVVRDYADSIRLFQNESQLTEAERRIRALGKQAPTRKAHMSKPITDMHTSDGFKSQCGCK